MKISKNKIVESLKQNELSELKLQFVCLDSEFNTIDVNTNQIERVLNNQFTINANLICESLSQEGEINLIPDLDTYNVGENANGEKIARIICDLEQNGQTFFLNPRRTLENSIKSYSKKDWEVKVETQLDFYLLEVVEDDYYAMSNSLTKEVIEEVKFMSNTFDIEIAQVYENKSTGKYSVKLNNSNPTNAADKLLTFKWILKTVAESFNMVPDFMPKMFNNGTGCGLEIGISLFEDGKNLFFNPTTKKLISIECNRFMVGILEKVKGFTSVLNPTINSYKRLNGKAPNAVEWSESNYGNIINVNANDNLHTKINIKNTDTKTNPYFALALLLSAGYEGIKMKLQPIPALTESNGTDFLPDTFGRALRMTKVSEFTKNVIGDGQLAYFYRKGMHDWNQYQKITHNWEITKYMSR